MCSSSLFKNTIINVLDAGLTVEWMIYFDTILTAVKNKSKDPRTKVGCVLIRDKRIITTGFNGLPEGVEDLEKRYTSSIKYDYIVHAEVNALMQCARYQIGSDGTIAFVTHPPCVECTKLLIQAGVRTIYVRDKFETKQDNGVESLIPSWFSWYDLPTAAPLINENWRFKLCISKVMLKEAGVKLFLYDENTKEVCCQIV